MGESRPSEEAIALFTNVFGYAPDPEALHAGECWQAERIDAALRRAKVEVVTITWRLVADELPPMNTFVLVHRVGGKNNHNDVGIGYREHKYGTRDEWAWRETGYGQAYWGTAVDGSEIVAWAYKPTRELPVGHARAAQIEEGE